MAFPSETLLSVRSDVAKTLDTICGESECDLTTVLNDMIAHMGGPEGAIIQIYHAHHAPQDDDTLPEPLVDPEPAFFGDDDDPIYTPATPRVFTSDLDE